MVSHKNTLPTDAEIEILKKEIRVLKKKLERSEANRLMTEEALESHIQALKVNNIELIQSRESIQESEARYRVLALYDPLTSLPTRVLLQERLERAIIHSARSNDSFAVLFLDLDKFKEVNDKGGHAIGDLVLCNTASRLTSCVRKVDTVSRLSGDEFVIVLEQISNRKDIVNIVKKIIAAVALPIVISNATFEITTSIGISLFPKDGHDAAELIKKADNAMYEIKNKCRASWMFFGDS